MTAEEVIALADRKARAAGRQWNVGEDDTIRCEGRCPLEVAGDEDDGLFTVAADKLAVNYADKWTVVATADYNVYGATYSRTLRALMLATFDFAVRGTR